MLAAIILQTPINDFFVVGLGVGTKTLSGMLIKERRTQKINQPGKYLRILESFLNGHLLNSS